MKIACGLVCIGILCQKKYFYEVNSDVLWVKLLDIERRKKGTTPCVNKGYTHCRYMHKFISCLHHFFVQRAAISVYKYIVV